MAREHVVGAAVILACTVGYCGALYVRHALKARAQAAARIERSEVDAFNEVVSSDAIAWLAEGRGGLLLGAVEAKGLRFETWEALATWLCSGHPPSRTSVLLRRGPDVAGLLELRLSRLTQPPGSLGCASTARFFLVEPRPP